MKRQNRIAFFNILSIVLLNGISLLTAPLFSRILGTSARSLYRRLKVYKGDGTKEPKTKEAKPEEPNAAKD